MGLMGYPVSRFAREPFNQSSNRVVLTVWLDLYLYSKISFIKRSSGIFTILKNRLAG
jgi:hypothetical protein